MRNGEQLTDVHITAAQKLIQKQFPHLDGLQSPLLSQGDRFLAMVDEGVQIHHIGNHWVTSTSIGGKITVYDSYYSYKLSTSLCHQLALLYKLLVITEEDGERVDPHLVVDVPNIKQQDGTKDCSGVFAIAYAYHASLGDDLSTIMFDQKKMRQHLETCFQLGKLSCFPHSIGYKPKEMHFPLHEIEVFCSCQMPETWDDMVCCDSCEEWYHLRCINLKSIPNSEEQWFCSACS